MELEIGSRIQNTDTGHEFTISNVIIKENGVLGLWYTFIALLDHQKDDQEVSIKSDELCRSFERGSVIQM